MTNKNYTRIRSKLKFNNKLSRIILLSKYIYLFFEVKYILFILNKLNFTICLAKFIIVITKINF